MRIIYIRHFVEYRLVLDKVWNMMIIISWLYYLLIIQLKFYTIFFCDNNTFLLFVTSLRQLVVVAPAPPTPNASVREASLSWSHGAGVVYDCHKHYIKSKYGNVSCQYGTWKGNIPTCKDSKYIHLFF